MYNNLVKELLSQIKKEDAIINTGQKQYSVSDNFSAIEIYISNDNVSYRVFGDAYLMAMVKWLQIKIQNKKYLRNITIESIVSEFDLPEIKYRNALQIIELIEKINEGTAV